jgi:hypothetical protein
MGDEAMPRKKRDDPTAISPTEWLDEYAYHLHFFLRWMDKYATTKKQTLCCSPAKIWRKRSGRIGTA